MDKARKLSIIYQDIRMGTQQEVEAAAKGTVFEGSYPVEDEKQGDIIKSLHFMMNGAKDQDAVASANRVLDQAVGINQKLSWG